jgi:putative phosphoribosyl transferase
MDRTFPDRRTAGQLLAQRLRHLAGPDTIVLGLPRGGLPVADEIARSLGAPLDIVVVRKIGMPANPELAIGAIAGPGGRVMVLNAELMQARGIDAAMVEGWAAPERAELGRRHKVWSAGPGSGSLEGRVVILVDDGLATGATMRAAISVVRADHPSRIVVAVPVAPRDTLDALSQLADEVVCLAVPDVFIAVSRHYGSFPQLGDEDVRTILAAAMADPLLRSMDV